MYPILKRSFILFLIAVFMAGTMGISVFEHICTCKNRTEITLFPEIFDHRSSCCCARSEAEHVNPDHIHLCGLDKPVHCKNIRFFIKATVTPAPLVTSLFSILKFEAPESPAFTALVPAEAESDEGPDRACCTSPPVSGRQIIIALHQAKIALPNHLRG